MNNSYICNIYEMGNPLVSIKIYSSVVCDIPDNVIYNKILSEKLMCSTLLSIVDSTKIRLYVEII